MKYNEYAEKIGFKIVKNVCIREEQGFKVYLKNWMYIILAVPSFYIPLDKPITKEDLKKLEGPALGNVGTTYTLGEKNDVVIVSLVDGKKDNQNVLDKIDLEITNVCSTLKELGYGPMTKCPFCHEEGTHDVLGDDYFPMHNECKEKYINDIKEKAKASKRFHSSNLLAILYSLIGAAIGILPALLLCIFKKGYFSPLICLVPLCSALGYYLSKTTIKKWIKITIGIMIFVIVVGFTCFAIVYMAKGNDLSVKDYMFGESKKGLKKAIIAFIASFGGFGTVKFINKFKKDYNQILNKINSENEL